MNVNTNCLTRKRIWEVDCWSLDSAIAASFEWRDLVNILQGHGHTFDLSKPESILELRAQGLIHEYCHSENEISVRIESLLNDWHQNTIHVLNDLNSADVAESVLTMPLSNKKTYGGLFWALGSESRDGFDCIRRRFHQRFQIFSVRKTAS